MNAASLMTCLGIGLAVSLGASRVDAEDAVPPDVVRLKDGGLIRGRIEELVPNKYVIIASATGKKRKLEMNDVEYAGPAEESKPATEYETEGASRSESPEPSTAGEVEDAADWVPIKLESPETGTTFFVKANAGSAFVSRDEATGVIRIGEYEQGCASPCVAKIRAGFHRMALELPGSDRKIDVDRSVRIKEPSLLRGHVEMHTGRRVWARIGGYGLPVLGLIGAGTILNGNDEHQTFALSVFGAGLVGGFVAFFVLNRAPEATISVTPVSLDSITKESARSREARGVALLSNPGLLVQGRF